MANSKFQPGSASFRSKKPDPAPSSAATIDSATYIPTKEHATPYSGQGRKLQYHLGPDSGSYREISGQFSPQLTAKEVSLAWEQIRNVCHCSASASQHFLTAFYHLDASHFSVTASSSMRPLRSYFSGGTLSDSISHQDAWHILQVLGALLQAYYTQKTIPSTHLGCMTLDHILYDPKEKQIQVIPAASAFHLEPNQPGFPPEMACATDHARVDIYMMCYVALCLLKKTTRSEYFEVSADRQIFEMGMSHVPTLRPTVDALVQALQVEPPSKTHSSSKSPAFDLSELLKKYKDLELLKKFPGLQEILEDWKAEPQTDKTGTV